MKGNYRRNAGLAVLFVIFCITGSTATSYYPPQLQHGLDSVRAGHNISFVCSVRDTSDDVMLQMLVEKVTGEDPIDKNIWTLQLPDKRPYIICNGTELNRAITRIRGDNYSVSISKTDTHTYLTLNITDAQPMDSGWWGCAAVYNDGERTIRTDYHNITVHGPLSYVVVQEKCCIYAGDGNENVTLSHGTVERTFFHGNTTDLTCQIGVTGSTAPTFKMTINSGSEVIEDLTEIFSIHYYDHVKSTLYGAALVKRTKALFYHDEDFRFDVDHHGRDFHCTAQLPVWGWPEIDASFTLFIESPPVRSVCNETIVYGVTGSKDVAVVCHVKGNPAPNISWTGPDNQPITSNKNINITEQVDGVLKISTIMIKKVKEGDHGNYTMTASNKYGTDYARAELKNELPPKPSSSATVMVQLPTFLALMYSILFV